MNYKQIANSLIAVLIGIVLAIVFTSIGQTILQKSILDFLLPTAIIGYFLLDLKLNPTTAE